jgi:hypothetical protein
MTRDDIARMARETGLINTNASIQCIERFGALVAAAEREACAKLMGELTCMGDAKECFEVAATYIRARGEQ